MGKLQRRIMAFNVSHPFWGSLLSGGLWGLSCWVMFGVWDHALNLFAFELWMGAGMVFMGPLVVAIARRRNPRGTSSN